MVYVELAFSCVVESSGQCPAAMREVFAELRSVVARFFPQREDIERLAVSSFLIMRFFSAAILNPKVFGLKREAPVSLQKASWSACVQKQCSASNNRNN